MATHVILNGNVVRVSDLLSGENTQRENESAKTGNDNTKELKRLQEEIEDRR